MTYYGISTPLDASYSNPNAQSQVNGLGTTLGNTTPINQSYGAVNQPLAPAIPVDSLSTKTAPPPTVPPPTVNPNYQFQTTGTNAIIGANNASLATPSTPPTDTSTSNPALDYIKGLEALQPPSAASAYTTDIANSNISGLQDTANIKAQATLDAQAKLATLNAQLNGINGSATAKNLGLQNEGGAITTNGVATASAQNIRDAAIQAIPLQTQILGAQAEVASAQGNQDLANQILQQAQDHVDKVFQIQQTDAQNQYNYQKDLITTYYDYATKEQQAQLDAKKTADAQAFQEQTNAMNQAQTLANTAISNGQSAIAGKILALNPSSSTYQSDVAKLANQITPKPSTSASTVTYSKPFTDANGNYVQLSSTGEVKVINSVSSGGGNGGGSPMSPAAMPYTSAYSSPSDYVNAILSSQKSTTYPNGIPYAVAQATTPKGTVSAIDNKTGQTVVIDAKDWNASSGAIRPQYTVIANNL